jgi:hypothetical protein
VPDDEIDRELRKALDNTTEDWKRALVISAIEARQTNTLLVRLNRRLLAVTAAALVVAVVVAVFR